MAHRLWGAIFAFIACFGAGAAWAADSIGMVTGPKTGTYYAFGKDIAQTASKAGIVVDVKPSEGSIDNIKRINSMENAALGIVQSDVLGFLGRSRNPDSLRMASNLRMVFPFYREEVHVLARKDIKRVEDLQGKKIAVGDDGSGHMLTALNLLSIMNVTAFEQLKVSPAQGVVMVLKGDADAIIFVGGKPVRLFKNLEDLALPENQKYGGMLDKVHFIPLDSPKMLEEYKPAEITPQDYHFIADKVPTVAVTAVMVSYDFSAGSGRAGRRCEKLGQLVRAIRDNLAVLKETGHPKWKEVQPDADAGIWKKDSCAWPQAASAASREDKQDLGSDLIGIIEKKQ